MRLVDQDQRDNFPYFAQLSEIARCKPIGGKLSSKNGEFAFPWGVICDSAGNVYVAGSANNLFTASGKFLRNGRHGKGEGELNFPVGVAVDSRGMVFVSESKNHRVYLCSPQRVSL